MFQKLKISDRLIRFIRKYQYLMLGLIGIFFFFLRNPDPLFSPIIYAEDGLWAGRGLTQGWFGEIFNARPDYLVVFNIFLLWFSTELSSLFAGNPLLRLPEAIAISSYIFFSTFSCLCFYVLKRMTDVRWAILGYIILVTVPFGQTMNEIVGRVLQVGFFMPFLAVMLLICRRESKSVVARFVFDLLVLVAAMTNPAVVLISGLFLALDFSLEEKYSSYFKRNLFLGISLFAIGIYLLPRLRGTGGIPGGLVFSGLIETIIARPLLYPFIFPWYSYLTDILVVILFISWIALIFSGYKLMTSYRLRWQTRFILISMFLLNFITIYGRPGLSSLLASYNTTFPDRYFVGLNIFVIFITIVCISQFSYSKRKRNMIFFMWSFFLLFNHRYIVEFHESKMPLMKDHSFVEQICRRHPYSPNVDIVDIYPSPWKMLIPAKLGNMSLCKNHN